MSTIHNQVITNYRASPGNTIAVSRQVAGGFRNIYREINEVGRMSERINNQWRAIGTTFRYAIAGAAVFGLTRMTGQLRDIQQQMGLISAIGSQPGGGIGGRAFSPRQVSEIGTTLRNASITAITPVNELNDAAINFLSTVQDVNPGELPSIITNIAQSAKLAQTPVEDLTKAATTMNIAFGRSNNRRNIEGFTRQFFALTTLAPGGITAGREVVQQFGPLAAMMALGRGPMKGQDLQSQMMSWILASLRFGGTPATAMRGLTFLTQSLIQPATPRATRDLRRIGITPQFIQEEGIGAAMETFLKYIRGGFQGGTPGLKQLAAIPEENLTDDMVLPGVPAERMAFLRSALGRIHGVRAAVILAEQMQGRAGVQSLEQNLEIMEKAQRDELDGTLNMAQAWERYRSRSKLAEAQAAIGAAGLQMAQSVEPILDFAAGGVTSAGRWAGRNPEVVERGTQIGAGLLAALGIGRFLRGGGLGRGAIAGHGVVAGIAARDAALNAGPGLSPQNPLYVIVVGELFGGSVVGGNQQNVPPGKPGWGRRALDFALGAGVTRAGMAAVGATGAALGASFVATDKTMGWLAETDIGKRLGIVDPKFSLRNVPENASRIWGDLQGVDQRFNNYIHEGGLRKDWWDLEKPTATLDVNIKQPDGSVEKKRVKVPVDIFSGGSFPTSQGKPGSSRGGR